MPPLLHSNVSSFHSSRHASSPCFLAAPPAAHRSLSCTNRISISRILPFRHCSRTFCCLHIQSLIAQQMPDRTPAYWSWLSPELPEMDELRGWSDVYSSDHALLQGAGLNIGAGIVLAISLSVASFLVFSKTGRLYQSFRSVTQEAHLHICPTGVSPESEEEVKAQNMENNIGKEESEVSGIAGIKDFRHDEALSTLQTLKIVEGSCQSVQLCSRREYARWLVLASNILARKPSERILPAMYIEGESSLAFDDIVPEDPDYPYIQGIAEAGLIESKLGFNDSNGMGDPVAYKTGENKAANFFLPDSCIKRQDVVSWKVALEHPFWWKFAEKVAESKLAYIDTGSIHTAARFAVLLDLSAGEKSIAASAFGYTRRFQPEHPVTKGQAAVAIVTGRMAVAVSEEMDKLHVQNSMNEVMMKELVLEAHAKKELDVEFTQVLAASRERATIDQANIVRAERWSECLLFERERSAIESEKQLLSSIREGLIGKSERLSVDETNLQIERSRCERLKIDAETRKQALLQATSIIEAEMRAIKSTRMWTEDEAKRSIAQAGILVQSKKRWGIKTSHSCHLEPENAAQTNPVRADDRK